jgi:hypothetical protein
MDNEALAGPRPPLPSAPHARRTHARPVVAASLLCGGRFPFATNPRGTGGRKHLVDIVATT